MYSWLHIEIYKMNDLFIKSIFFDWNKIRENSYLRRIEAFHGIERLDFKKPITFFVGEKGSGKSTLLEAMAIAHGFNPEGGTKIMHSLPTIPIQSYTMPSEFQKVTEKKNGVIS